MALSIGVIGLGVLGRLQAEVLDGMDDVELIAGADISTPVRTEFDDRFDARTYRDHDELLEAESIDAVAIVTPHEHHYEQIKAALTNDVHVHVEKPLVTRTEDALELIDIANHRDRRFQVGYQRHFEPAYREIRRIVTGGEIGDPHLANCHLGQEWVSISEGTWRMDPDLSGGGQLIDSGSHLLDALLWTTDMKPRRVTALTDNRGFDVDVNSAVSAQLTGSSGSMLANIAITGEGRDFNEQLTIWGTEGKLTYGNAGFILERDGRPDAVIEPEQLDYREANRRKLRGFIEAINNGTSTPVPAEFGLRVTQLTDAVYRASESGSVIDVDSLGRAATKPKQH